MSNRLVQYGFTAGIVDEDLWAQTILQKYGYGLADVKNYIIDYTGTLISRCGTVGSSLLDIDDNETYRIFPFIFAEEDANTFLIVFTDEKIRFLQQGYYQLEAAKSVTAITDNASYTEFACTGHGYSVGDLIEFYGADVPTALVGQTVKVSAVPDANTFRCTPIGIVSSMDSWADASTAAVSAYRVYTLTSSYTEADLSGLYFSQARDQITITSRTFPPTTLARQSDGTWTLTEEEYDIQQVSPANFTRDDRSGTGTAGMLFAVTAVSAQGEESLPTYYLEKGCVDYSYTAGWISLVWDIAVDAITYNVYRSSIFAEDDEISFAVQLGYIGTAYGPRFTDDNIIPDFTSTPPKVQNPFANAPITRVNITNGGTGYSRSDVGTITDAGGGTGAIVTLIIDSSAGGSATPGTVIGVLIENGGQNYVNPVLTITTSGGSGAAFTFDIGPTSGNYPAISTLFAQRQLFASSANYPMVFWGSQIGLFNNFTYSRIVADDESYLYEFSSLVVGDIRHMLETGAGLLVFSNLGVWLARGSQGTAITPTDIQADQQTSLGCSTIPPLKIDADILYFEKNNRAARLLQFNDYASRYGGLNVSVLAKSLFAYPYDLSTTSHEQRPRPQVFCARSDGQLLAGTIMTEQQVFAWGRNDTAGKFENVCTLPESEREVTYVVASRYLSGRWCKVVEYFASRERSLNEDHVGVDCAVPFGGSTPAARLTIDYATVGTGRTVTASAAVFSLADEGKYIKYRNGKAIITTYNSSTSVEVEVINEFSDLIIPYLSTVNKTIPSGDWMLTELVTSYQLPLNFRPASVSIIGDGKLEEEVAVDSDGTVLFAEDYSFGYIGLPFDCYVKALPLAADRAIIEDSRKNIKGVGIRFIKTRGLQVGTDEDYLYDLDVEQADILVEPDKLRSGREYIVISDDWTEDSQIIMKASGAYMTQICGIVVDLDVGDEVS